MTMRAALGLLLVLVLVAVACCASDQDKPHGEDDDAPQKPAKIMNRGLWLRKQGWMIYPVIIGILMKVAASIPFLMTVAVMIGSAALFSSKISLLISAFLGYKTIMEFLGLSHKQFLPSPPSPSLPMPSHDDLRDIQNLVSFQHHQSFLDKFHNNNQHLLPILNPIQNELYSPHNFYPSASGIARDIPQLDDIDRASFDPYGNPKQRASQVMAASALAALDRTHRENPGKTSAVLIEKTVHRKI